MLELPHEANVTILGTPAEVLAAMSARLEMEPDVQADFADDEATDKVRHVLHRALIGMA